MPGTIELVTDAGSVNANVTWDVNRASYDPSAKTAQTFTVTGTVTLPEGVSNPNHVALTTDINVTVCVHDIALTAVWSGVDKSDAVAIDSHAYQGDTLCQWD
ncbi:hypothetical protein V7087_17585 [Neobacillus niacini]|uniref:hypothetical protein n=1 Tax=Neobacillus niacini TaxID=86668 RepID=UPI002FFEDA95